MKSLGFSLTQWFRHSKRDFPWRKSPSPYQVWVSEVMLQQTRASVVIPYFLRWMERFPSVNDLAQASELEVIKAWEGLGYYSRARNLHLGAKQVIEYFNGKLPSDPAKLQTIKGLGPYTIGAILSFAFGKKYPAIDSNVLRVLARHFLIEKEITGSSARKEAEKIALSIIPEENPATFNEALVELGALICTSKNPRCVVCPIRKTCKAYALDKVHELPIKKTRQKITPLFRSVFIIQNKNFVLLKTPKKGQIMDGLYEFPYVEKGEDFSFDAELTLIHKLPTVTHTFTRYKATLYPLLHNTNIRSKTPGHEWVKLADLADLPFSSGHRKILKTFITPSKDTLLP